MTSRRPFARPRVPRGIGFGRHAGPALVAAVLAASSLLGSAPFVPGTRALDPTPEPTTAPAPLPVAGETSAPEPTPDPTAVAVTPAPESTPAPVPTASPAPSASPTSTPAPVPTPVVTPPPAPTVAPASPTTTPTPTSTATLSPSASPSEPPAPSPIPSATPSATPEPTPAGGLVVTHAWVDGPVTADGAAPAGPLDAPRTGLERFTVYVVRFQVANTGTLPVELRPALEAAAGASPAPGDFRVVPAVDPVRGAPFYAAPDKGRTVDVRVRPIAAADLRLPGPDGAPTAAPGVAADGVNPLPALVLAAGSHTEVAVAVRATNEARWLASYTFRLADAAAVPAERAGRTAATATVTLRAKPAVRLTPGQRTGADVDEPLPLYPLAGPKASAMGIATVQPASVLASAASVARETSPHQPYGLASDSCAACHATHTAAAPLLRAEPAPLSGTCFQCHDGSGSTSDVRAELTDPTLPANDPATDSWYVHPALADGAHATDREDEFGGASERHATCADCHQPHRADGTLARQTTGGWTAAGSIAGASGVEVANGGAGSAPAYTWTRSVAFEYQLCFKCHAGFTDLPPRDPAHPSRWAIDKAMELNPANLSYHPVEAAGTNATARMAASLTGTSPYKLWDFRVDSTVRCVNCHAAAGSAPAGTAPEARLSNHASRNRSILLANYRDRALLGPTELYDARNFALCYLCHAEAPMVDDSGDPRADSGFNWHGLHVSSLIGIGAGTGDIDTDGAGRGNAICAECHFRIHGSSDPVDGQPQAPRLVNFAPNVQPLDGTLEFTPANGGFGTCTLTCHGQRHDGYLYD